MVVHSLKSMRIPSFLLIGCCVSELYGHICPYRNVWPQAVYCCFIRTTMFTELFCIFVSIPSPSFVALHILVYEIAKCIARGCLLLFYKNYIVYYNVYCYFVHSLKMHRNACILDIHVCI